MNHPALIKWEIKLKDLVDELDDHLENLYGSKYNLHPTRPTQGETSNKAHDGLFDIVASFSMGLGSELGRGYVIDIHMSTLENVPDTIRDEINTAALEILQKRLPEHFPGKDLKVSKDGNIIKLHGNLNLGELKD